MDSFDISSDSEEGLLDEIVVTGNNHSCYKHPFNLHHHPHQQQHQYQHHHQHHRHQNQNQQQQQHQHQQHEPHSQYDPLTFPSPHFCEHNLNSDDNSSSINETSSASTTNTAAASSTSAGVCINGEPAHCNPSADGSSSSEASTATTSRGGSGNGAGAAGAGDNCYDDAVELSTSGQVTLGTATTSFNHQLTADMCSYKNSKSRRLEYSLKCLKYGRSNPSQDSAFGSLTDGDLSIGSSSFRLSSFQSITSPIDEGVEDIIIATTTAGSETCLELATVSTNGQSNDSAISTPCREGSPNFLAIEENSFTTSTTGSNNHNRPQQFPVTLSPKIQITTSASTSNLQFDPPKILVNDQNSIYTTSPSKRSGTIEVFSQKYRVCSFEDMSPNRKQSKYHLKNANRLAFRSLEEEQRIDSAFIPIQNRTNSENRVNINNSEKYKKLTHTSFSRISKTTSSVTVAVEPPPNSTNAASNSQPRDSRHTLWRDSKFYRKNRIAKSNDSLLESPNHSPSPCRLSPSSLRDNHYEASSPLSSSSSSSFTRHGGLNRGSSVNEISQNCNGSSPHRRYCSSKSEDLGDLDMPTTIDGRKSHSERHLFGLSKLRQTAINTTIGGGSTGNGHSIGGECFSEDETFHQDDNKSLKSLSTCSINRVTLTTTTTTTRTKKKTTSMAVLPSSAGPTITCNVRNSVFKSLDHALNYIDSNGDDDDVSSSTEESPSRRHYSDIARIFGSTTTSRATDDPHSSSCSEEKTPLLDSVEMSPISPTEPDLNM
ncbi:rho GTPase-activating protein gacF-like [Eupeodes corollae]|uniref:rho GTPase-activating protein gacF-like n=1 Tax=Eupeodes corollae TaxID=290404 RepID=UPI002492BF9B|nr:rho GTPase-activating protein gacF-like [Eupeodes corollae]XP_055916097.1 rho GTPase-activating protein gacF-like [Eupeodes corollae]